MTNRITKPALRRLGALLMAAMLPLTPALAAHDDDDDMEGLWPSAGQNLDNSRFQREEDGISVRNVSRLGPKWIFVTEGDVSATPAVDNQRVYVPDWKGNLYAVDRKTGLQVWSTKISAATGVALDKSRTTPLISGNKLIVGTQGARGGGGKLLAYNKKTGALLWSTQLDAHPATIVTQSPVVYDDKVFIGLSSSEEGLAAAPGYPCCSFRASMMALNEDTGAVLWKTHIVPPGFSGGAIWGSSPAIDRERKQVYVATGNNYSVPPSVLACVVAAGSNPVAVKACIPANNYTDSVMALNLKTGAVRWSTTALPFDAWTVDCLPGVGNGKNCPNPAGPDFDFGQGPALFTARNEGGGKPKEFVGAGQKSGQYWTFDPDNGAVRWVTAAGPGGVAGGLQWGSAVDGKRVYTANANSNRKPWTLPNGNIVTTGIWSGLNAATGAVQWQTAPPHGGSTSGPVTTANGVVFGCSLDPLGYMYAMNAATGAVLWQYASGGSCLSGAAISNGTVFWGSGYTNFGLGTANNKLYAFEVK